MWTNIFPIILAASILLAIPAIWLSWLALRSNDQLWQEIEAWTSRNTDHRH